MKKEKFEITKKMWKNRSDIIDFLMKEMKEHQHAYGHKHCTACKLPCNPYKWVRGKIYCYDCAKKKEKAIEEIKEDIDHIIIAIVLGILCFVLGMVVQWRFFT